MVLWCSACGGFALENHGKAQLLLDSCARAPSTPSAAKQLKLLKQGVHPPFVAPAARGEGEGARRKLGKAMPVASCELEFARQAAAAKKEALSANSVLNAPRPVAPDPVIPLAEWVAHFGLTTAHFSRDDLQQGGKRKRLRRKTRQPQEEEFASQDEFSQ